MNARRKLAATKAWHEVKKRLQGTPALSHLSYLATYMKRAAGKSKKHAIWRHEVNRLLPECQRAVPVWIMMLQDALLNFNIAEVRHHYHRRSKPSRYDRPADSLYGQKGDCRG